MKWLCTLIQRRLPDYPDGDLSPFWKRRVAAHLAACPECRQELEELREVIDLYQAHPLPEPEPAFWEGFNRELHLQLAQANQAASPELRGWRLPQYLVGAAALAGIVAIAVYLAPFTGSSPVSQVATTQEKAPVERPADKMLAAPPAPAATPAPAPLLVQPGAAPAPDYSLAARHPEAARQTKPERNGLWPEDDILSWDVDDEVSDLSRQEQEALKKKLEAKE